MNKHYIKDNIGYVQKVNHMGDDQDIANAARVVDPDIPNRELDKDIKLIRYMLKHKHSSPFEMATIILCIKLPVFVERQWARHRTSSTNEISGRYAKVKDEFWIPNKDQITFQNKENKQLRTNKELPNSNLLRLEIINSVKSSYETYKLLLKEGVAREVARTVLPLSMYTKKYWKVNARNLMHFLTLRCHETAQPEIQEYAIIIRDIIFKNWLPVTYDAYIDLEKSISFSNKEQKILYQKLQNYLPTEIQGDMTVSEWKQFNRKLNLIESSK